MHDTDLIIENGYVMVKCCCEPAKSNPASVPFQKNVIGVLQRQVEMVCGSDFLSISVTGVPEVCTGDIRVCRPYFLRVARVKGVIRCAALLAGCFGWRVMLKSAFIGGTRA